MDFIREGKSWRRIERLQVFLKVCDAIGFAHAQGIVHRDLKPSNIMVGAHGEVLVVDWGLARAIGEPGSGSFNIFTGHRHTSVVGTPGFMAPEQARGEATLQNERTDIFALGALLHGMLTGRVFYDDAHVALAAAQSGKGPPIGPPRSLFSKELRAIVVKACQPEAADRYQTVDEMRAEIVRFLDDEPIRSMRYSIIDQVRRWMRHHRGLVVGTMAVGTTAILLMAASGTLYIRDVARAQWATERQLGLTEVAQSELLLRNSRIEEGISRARSGLERLEALGIDTEVVSLSVRLHDQLQPGRYLRWPAGTGSCHGLALNADGSRGLSAIGNEVALWSLPDAQRLATWTIPSVPQQVALSFIDDRATALWSAGETYEVVTIPDGSVVRSFGPGTRASFLRSPDAVVVHQKDQPPTVYGRLTGDILTLYDGPEAVWGFSGGGNAVRFDPPGSGPMDWQVGERRFQLEEGSRLAISSDGRFVYTQSASGKDPSVIHDLEDGRETQLTALDGDRFWFSRDSSVLMSQTFDDEIVVRDTYTGEVKVRAQGIDAGNRLGVSGDGRRMLACKEGDLLLYLLDGQGAPIQVPMGEDRPIAVEFSRDGVLVAVSGFFDGIRLFEAGTRRAVGQFGPTPDGTRDVAFSPDDSLLASAGRDGRVSIWNVASGTLSDVHQMDDQRVCSVDWLDASTLIALGCRGRLMRWSIGASPKTIWEREGESWLVRKTPADMLVLAQKVGFPNLVLLDPETGTVLSQTAGPVSESARYGLAISPDGTLVAASSGSGTVYVHDLSSMSLVAEVGASLGPALGIAFHRTLPLLVASTSYGELVFWDTETWERLSTIQSHANEVNDAAISDDGRWLASVADGSLTVFDLDGALPWQSTAAVARPLRAAESATPERTRALGRTAAAYGAPQLALSLVGAEVDALERARLVTLADESGAEAAWRRAADEGAVSPAVLALILASLERPEP